ncbi:hypothetical protein ACFLY2_02710 [Patescibacteria group bacterium]
METYYTEVLIHLEILFESEIIKINSEKKIELNYSDITYSKFKELNIFHYKKLINIYLNKIDAGEFLNDYTIKTN